MSVLYVHVCLFPRRSESTSYNSLVDIEVHLRSRSVMKIMSTSLNVYICM